MSITAIHFCIEWNFFAIKAEKIITGIGRQAFPKTWTGYDTYCNDLFVKTRDTELNKPQNRYNLFDWIHEQRFSFTGFPQISENFKISEYLVGFSLLNILREKPN